MSKPVFIRTRSTTMAADYITKQISDRLDSGKAVLWLVSGGSAVAVAAEVSKLLTGRKLDKLTISLIDERFGDVGHADSNWRQLQKGGFSLPGARPEPVLKGKDLAGTILAFKTFLKNELGSDSYKIGLFGIGADGHTAGILPGSPAIDSKELVCAYSGPDFQRITMAFPAIKRLDEAILYAMGENKWPQLDNLAKDLSLAKQPAQILKQIPKLTVYNDHIGNIS